MFKKLVQKLKGNSVKKKDEKKSVPVEQTDKLSQSDLEERLHKELEALAEMFGGSVQLLNGPSSTKSKYKTYTSAKHLPNSLSQISEEISNHTDDTEHWSEMDFIEHLLGFHNSGYEFEGLEEMYRKAAQNKDLTEDEVKKLKNWYVLASMELVYDEV